MKYELHVPVEQYGFVSAILETDDVSEVRTTYEQIKDQFKSGEGMEVKEWNECVSLCLAEKLSLTPEQWESMSPQQQWFLKTIKNARNRKPVIS